MAWSDERAKYNQLEKKIDRSTLFTSIQFCTLSFSLCLSISYSRNHNYRRGDFSFSFLFFSRNLICRRELTVEITPNSVLRRDEVSCSIYSTCRRTYGLSQIVCTHKAINRLDATACSSSAHDFLICRTCQYH